MNSDFVVAVHALVFLFHKKRTLSSEELAENVCTNPVRIRRVMAKMNKAGLVEARRGHINGGYSYEAPGRLTLRQVAGALDGQLVETGWRSGSEHLNCMISSGMAGYMDGLYRQMNETCMEYLDTITIADVEKQLFNKKTGPER